MDKTKLIELKTAMEREAGISAKIKSAKDELAERLKPSETDLKTCREEIASLKFDLSAEAMEDFKADPDKKKKRDGGIGIRETKSISYDQKEALSWAKEKDMFVSLDTESFEKAAPGMGLDFVTVIPKFTATFPKEIKIDE